MKVLANRYLYRFREIMPESVQVDFFDPKHLPESATEYDALFVNTTTPLNAKTLPEPGNISFVATGSSGTDHLDREYLNSQNIRLADANGCNAVTVAEYVTTVLLTTLDDEAVKPENLTAGIIGVGAVGTEVHKLLSNFSILCVLFDPPRAERDSTFNSAYFGELKDCDLLTFHTPLTDSGQYPTRHMFNNSWLGETRYKLLINSSRVGVIDESAALKMMSNENLDHLILDTWEGEPDFNPTVAKSTRFATPHIAGYSIQSKLRATEMIVNQFCEHAGLEMPTSESYDPFVPELKDSYDSLADILLELHPLGWFDQQMRTLCPLEKSSRAESFSLLRSESTLRHEYSNIRIKSHHLSKFPQLEKLGIKAL